MADIFVSYARADQQRVQPIVRALEELGYDVWWDRQIAAGEEFDATIDAQLQAASCVLVVWTTNSVTSRWVRGEARDAADRKILVPIRFDAAQLPIDARALNTEEFDDWGGDTGSAAFRALAASIETLVRKPDRKAAKPEPKRKSSKPAICVLPFENISGDPEQAYFSDGITEDIITDLSHISSLDVTSRNSAFTYKGKAINIPEVARQLGVTHILEGSVRKAGNRVRITAQLIEGATDKHLWAERYDRELDDIFAVQDDISRSIVSALQVRLGKAESQAIAQRGTTNPKAYRFYLMARGYWLGGWSRRKDVIVRLCERALEIDAGYARAWALLAICLADIRFNADTTSERGLEAAERALELDPSLADAYAAKARILAARGKYDESWPFHQRALKLDPEAYEVNVGAARWAIFTKRLDDALRYLKTAAAADAKDFWAVSMMFQVYDELGDEDGQLATAHECIARVEKALEEVPDNSNALAFGLGALFRLGETDRAKEWAELVSIFDPDNLNALYNTACSLAVAGEIDDALDFLERACALTGPEGLYWMTEDHDMDNLRDHPRYKAIVKRAEERLKAAG